MKLTTYSVNYVLIKSLLDSSNLDLDKTIGLICSIHDKKWPLDNEMGSGFNFERVKDALMNRDTSLINQDLYWTCNLYLCEYYGIFGQEKLLETISIHFLSRRNDMINYCAQYLNTLNFGFYVINQDQLNVFLTKMLEMEIEKRITDFMKEVINTNARKNSDLIFFYHT